MKIFLVSILFLSMSYVMAMPQGSEPLRVKRDMAKAVSGNHPSSVKPGVKDRTPAACDACGRSVIWDAFYNAPVDQKDEILAEAIKYIDIPTARRLIAGGYFASKPRSWQAFSAAIRLAQHHGDIDSEVASDVLDRYGQRNSKYLGYTPSER